MNKKRSYSETQNNFYLKFKRNKFHNKNNLINANTKDNNAYIIDNHYKDDYNNHNDDEEVRSKS